MIAQCSQEGNPRGQSGFHSSGETQVRDLLMNLETVRSESGGGGGGVSAAEGARLVASLLLLWFLLVVGVVHHSSLGNTPSGGVATGKAASL